MTANSLALVQSNCMARPGSQSCGKNTSLSGPWATRLALLEDRPLAFTRVEFDLLASLARARGWVKTRDQLLEEIRDRNYEVFDRSIEYLPIGGRH